jgi:hypothetical protein
MTHNVDMILDAHTHLTGSEEPKQVLECMNACAVEKAFLFAPELDVATRRLTNDNMDDIRTHNDYCADFCSAAPDRLLGFCTLNPTPNLADGDVDRAVDLMIEEAHRCYDELGLRGAGELVPTRWYPNDPRLLPLWETLAELGMYTVFHTGIFYDGRESTYCRPVFYEAIHQVPGLKGHLAHVGWPWHDECIAVLNIGSQFMRIAPEEWGFKVDLSFGPPPIGNWRSGSAASTPCRPRCSYMRAMSSGLASQSNTARSTSNLSWGSSRRRRRWGTSWKKAAPPAKSTGT